MVCFPPKPEGEAGFSNHSSGKNFCLPLSIGQALGQLFHQIQDVALQEPLTLGNGPRSHNVPLFWLSALGFTSIRLHVRLYVPSFRFDEDALDAGHRLLEPLSELSYGKFHFFSGNAIDEIDA